MLLAALSPAVAQQTAIVEADGVITAVDVAARRIKIKHGDIPGFMGPMEMEYRAARSIRLQALTPGQRVRFSIRRRNGAIERLMLAD